MCGAGLKKLLVSLLLFSALSLSPCFAEVVLTDAEAEEILTEIEESKKELTGLKEELKAVKTTSQEQKEYYETQLTEEKKKRVLPWTIAGTSSVLSVLLGIALILAL